MSRSLLVTGGIPLEGTIPISGSKNAAIPCLAASLLTDEQVSLHNIPSIEDSHVMVKILESLNVETDCNWRENTVNIRANEPLSIIPQELSILLRGSTVLMGALIARTGYVRIEGYGGCPIGERPIDFHLSAFKALGARIKTEPSFVEISADQLKGGEIGLPTPSVGATENVLIASSLAKGSTILRNAAIEPEVLDLIGLLQAMGIDIEIEESTRVIKVAGKEDLHSIEYTIIPDRIEAGTYAVAAGVTRGKLELDNVAPEHLGVVLEQLKKIGLTIEQLKKNRLRVEFSDNRLKNMNVVTEAYPGFPTDMQPQFVTLSTQASGTSHILETIWENRFHHVPELMKMGANIHVRDRECIVDGPTHLKGAIVDAKDIRGGAALVLAALSAEGQSRITGLEHVERGYENLQKKLAGVGGVVEEIEYD